MNRWWKALILVSLGSAFVRIVILLNHHEMGGAITFWLLLPGLAAGAAVPDSNFDYKSNNPWGPTSSCVFYVVNIALYTGIAYLILNFIHRLRASLNKRRTNQSPKSLNPG